MPDGIMTGTQAAYARHRRVSRETVGQWRREGYLTMRRGRVDFAASDARLAEAGRSPGGKVDATLASARRRKAAVQVKVLVDKVAAFEGSLVSVAAADACWVKLETEFADATMTLAAEVAPRLLGRTAEVIHDTLAREIHAMLVKFGGGEGTVDEADDDPPARRKPRNNLPTAEADLAALKMNLQTKMTELQHGLASGELERRHEGESWFFTKSRAVRDQLLVVPVRVALPLSIAKDLMAFEAILVAEFVAALEAGDGRGYRARKVKSVAAALRRTRKAA